MRLSGCVLELVLWAQTAAELQLVSFPVPAGLSISKMPKSCAETGATVQLPELLQPLHLTLTENAELEHSASTLNGALDENTVQR